MNLSHTWMICVLQLYSFYNPQIQGGPLPVINGVIAPISRVKELRLPTYFRPSIGVTTGSGAHLVGVFNGLTFGG